MAKSNVSPVLFMTTDGEPMSFFLRPGPVKFKLQPLITAGGGLFCNVQQPGAILLIDPEERASVPESTAHWYISTQYINDCIEKNQQLNLEDYRVNPVVGPKKSAQLKNTKDPIVLVGRLGYTPEDDAAILSYVNNRKTEVGGNRLWQEMEKQRVTNHTWQSMKNRYKVRLAKKQSEAAKVGKTAEETEDSKEESKVEGIKEREGEKPSGKEDAESDPKQIDTPSISAENTQPENVDAQTSKCSQGEEQKVDPEKDKQPVETTKGQTDEPETHKSPQDEGHCLDQPTDSDPPSAGRAAPHSDDPQAEVSPQKESMPENAALTQLPSSSSRSKKMPKASPRPEQPQRRSTRRQLELHESPSPEHYNKRLRSSASLGDQLSSSPQPLKKSKQAINSTLYKDTAIKHSLSKKARGKSVAASAESQRDQDQEQAPVSETETADVSLKRKSKEKRTLGILAMATKEFEDESESDDMENSGETSVKNPIEPPIPSSDMTASTQSGLEPGPGPGSEPGSGPESGSDSGPGSGSGPGLDIQKNVQETQASGGSSPAPAGPAKPEATNTTPEVHHFIFNNSHEDDPQAMCVDKATAAPVTPEPKLSTKSTLSLTQSQLEEDKQQIRALMSQTNQDLVTVTKALLKTSGDFLKACDLLLNDFSISEPLWQCCDDDLLIPGDPAVLQQMQEKYSEELVAKRIAFLELEGWQTSGRSEGCFS